MQQNAAASEELSSTSEEMSGQAMRLQEAIGYFKLSNDHFNHASSRSQSKKIKASGKKAGHSTQTASAQADDNDKHFVRYD